MVTRESGGSLLYLWCLKDRCPCLLLVPLQYSYRACQDPTFAFFRLQHLSLENITEEARLIESCISPHQQPSRATTLQTEKYGGDVGSRLEGHAMGQIQEQLHVQEPRLPSTTHQIRRVSDCHDLHGCERESGHCCTLRYVHNTK